MDEETALKISEWAKKYNVSSFISDDPIQFPHRFVKKQDIEISAFLTAWICYGRREIIVKKAEWLHEQMGESPYGWIMDEQYLSLGKQHAGKRDTFYRFYTFDDLKGLCARLRIIYSVYDSMEEAFLAVPSETDPLQKLQEMFVGIRGIPEITSNSACKRLALFLRWMVRCDGIVDLSLWRHSIKPSELIIPLDTHVHQISICLGLTIQKTANMKAAIEITEHLKKIFPEDPCLGDFALFGYDIKVTKEHTFHQS